jgi:hypothetical protein
MQKTSLALLLAALALSGCETLVSVEKKAVDAADGVLVGAEWTICRAATVGSVLRRYGTSPERMNAWVSLCQPNQEELFRAP